MYLFVLRADTDCLWKKHRPHRQGNASLSPSHAFQPCSRLESLRAYGGYSRHGGGAFSGKDPTKVDRSAAYAARYVAKNIVAAGLADKCEIELAYAIGVAQPVSIYVETFGTGKISDDDIMKLIEENFDLRPRAIITQFDLRNLPAKNGGKFYQKLAAYGHLGRTDFDVPWEHLDKVELLKEKATKLTATV